MDKNTQKNKIIQYCEQHGSCTVREISSLLDINSPTARISELRKAGCIVGECWESRIKDDGTEVKWKRYFMKRLKPVTAGGATGAD